MEIPFFQIDAFSSRAFAGNPAAVCVLEKWLSDNIMQSIAAENNLSETAFLVPVGEAGEYHIRWFTPSTEVDLCGHATMAAGHVVLEHLQRGLESAAFSTRSGNLAVRRDGTQLVLDMPTLAPKGGRLPAGLSASLSAPPIEVLEGAGRFLLRYRTEQEIAALSPDFLGLAMATDLPIIVTAPGESSDFVIRFFAPGHGANEDPVTGSAFCVAGPFWASRLEKTELHVRQLSLRGGEAWLDVGATRTQIKGDVTEIIRGTYLLE